MKKILLTGSNGFLGEEIFNELKQEYEFILLDKDDNQFISSTVNSIFYRIDIRDKNQLTKIFQKHKIDIILHCAAELLDEKNSSKVWETNSLISSYRLARSNMLEIINLFNESFIYKHALSKLNISLFELRKLETLL